MNKPCIIFVFVLCLVAFCNGLGSYAHSQVLDSSTNYVLRWNVTSSYIYFAMSATCSGWIGLGISADGTMPNSDIWMGYTSGGTWYLGDYWATQTAQPNLDATQNAVFVAGSSSGGTLTVEFKRLLNTGDTAEDYVINPYSPSWVIWAINSRTVPTSQTSWTKHTSRNSTQITFSPVNAPSVPLNFNSSNITSTSVLLQWSPPSTDGGAPITTYYLLHNMTGTFANLSLGNVTKYTPSGLSPATKYQFQVAAVNGFGSSTFTSAVVITTLATVPNAPQAPVLNSAGSSWISLTWATPSYNGGSTITQYHLQMDDGAGGAFTEIYAGSLLSFNKTGLNSGTTYRFQVAAQNSIGTGNFSSISSMSTNSNNSTVATVPLNLQAANRTVSWIYLTWGAPTSNGGSTITSYDLQMNSTGNFVSIFTGLAFAYNQTNLASGGTFQFRVAAINSVGTGPYSTVQASTLVDLPSQPSNFQSSQITNSTITLSWSLPSYTGGGTIQSYNLQQNVSGNFVTIFSGSATSFMVSNLSPVTTYQFQVAAVNSAGAGPFASTSATTLATVPDAPQAPILNSAGTSWLSVSWAAPGFNGGSTITQYHLQMDDGAGGLFTEIYAGSLFSFNKTGLLAATTYRFQIAAQNAIGTGSFSNFSSLSTNSNNSTVPQAPTALSASSITPSSIYLSWNAPSSNGGSSITGYDLQMNVSGSFQTIYSGSQLHFNQTSLSPASSYQFRVAAINSIGEGNFSSIVQATTSVDVPGKCSAVNLLTSSASSLTVGWSAPTSTGGAQILGYVLQMKNSSTGSSYKTMYNGTATNFTVGNLATGVYYFTVAAYNMKGMGVASDSVLFATVGYLGPSILPGEFNSTIALLSGTYRLHWKLLDSQDQPTTNHTSAVSVVFAIEADATGWVGFGLGTSMTGADMIIGAVRNGTNVTINDYYSTDSGVIPPTDISRGGANNVLSFNGQEVNNVTTIKFKRLLSTGDTNSDIVINKTSPLDIIFAFHRTEDNLNTSHALSDSGTATIDLFATGSICLNNCSGQGICLANATCSCNPGRGGDDCSLAVYCLTDQDCNGNGTCSSGVCNCYPGFGGNNCQDVADVLSPDLNPDNYTYHSTVLNGAVTFYWIISNDTIELALQATGSGWVGFGLGSSMFGADIYLGNVVQGVPLVQDTWSTEQSTPKTDASIGGTNNIIAFNGEEKNGKTILKFKRLLKTGDSNYDKDIVSGTMDAIIAYNPTSDDTSKAHTVNHRTALTVNFYTGQVVEKVDKLRELHGILMSLGWAVFIIVAVFIAKFGKGMGHLWFILHIALNVIGLLCIVAGFAIAIIMVPNDFHQPATLSIVHSYMGLSCVILGCIQPLLGWYADKVYDPEREKIPIWPDQIHWYIGKLAIAAAIVTIFIGFYVLQVSLMYVAIFSAWIALLISVWVILWIREKRKKPEKEFELSTVEK